MIARTTAVIEPGGVLGELSCAPPLTLRQVRGEKPFFLISLRQGDGVEDVVGWVRQAFASRRRTS